MAVDLKPEPRPDDWMQLKRLVPPEHEALCDHCYTYTKRRERSPQFLVNNFVDLQKLILKIIDEYLSLVTRGANDEDRKNLTQDIYQVLSRLFDREGRFRDVDNDMRVARDEGRLMSWMSNFLAPFDYFIESRVYDSLRFSLHKALWGKKSNFRRFFSLKSFRKAGIFPEHVTESEAIEEEVEE